MVEVECDICCESRPLADFLFSPCGHGFCKFCTESLEESPKCPSCRKPRKSSELHKIFVTPSNAESHATSLASSMERLRPGSNPSSAQKVADGIRKVTAKVDTKTAGHLLKVAHNMEERLLPIFFQMRLEQDEKRALQEKVNLWYPQIKLKDSLESEVARLKGELEISEKAKQELSCENKRLTKRLEAEKTESNQLRKDVIDERRLVKEKDVMIEQLVQERKNAEKQVELAHTKMKILARGSSAKRKTSNQNCDDSLIVEPALSRNVRK